jgi:hypothetical protein
MSLTVAIIHMDHRGHSHGMVPRTGFVTAFVKVKVPPVGLRDAVIQVA